MHSGVNARPGREQFKEGKQSKTEFTPDARPGKTMTTKTVMELQGSTTEQSGRL